jgi:hypothetical protein
MTKRRDEMETQKTKAAIQLVSATIQSEKTSIEEIGKTFDMTASQEVFDDVCTQCHTLANVEKNPPANEAEATALVNRMIDNGMDISEDEFQQVVFYLTRKYAR